MENRFIIELDNFYYPRQELFEYQDNNADYKANIHFKSAHNYDTATQSLFFDLTGKNCEVANRFVESIGLETDYKFTKVLAGGEMPAHFDPYRTAVLMLPLTDEPSPIVYYENDVKVFEHTYTKPTIINAKINPLYIPTKISFPKILKEFEEVSSLVAIALTATVRV